MEPIRTALLSFGMSGQVFHAPFLLHDPRFQLTAVWERSANVAQEKIPGVKTYRTLQELLSDISIELVVVNTPNYTHFDYAKQALLAGKHVVVEKPFTVQSAQADELIQLANKQGRILTVYHNRRFDSDFRAIREVVDKGWLGEIVEAEFHYDRYKEALSYKQHKETPGPGSGALYDLGSHLIDQALSLFGFPEKLFADLRTLRPGSQVDDYFELLFYYKNLRVRLHCSYIVREALPAYVLHGRLGSFIKPKTDVQEAALQAGALPGSKGWGEEPENERGLLHVSEGDRVRREYLPSHRGNYGDYFTALAAAIREGGPVPVEPTEARDVIRIIEAAFESNRSGKIFTFDQ